MSMERLALIFLAKDCFVCVSTRACWAELSPADCTACAVDDKDLPMTEAAPFTFVMATSLLLVESPLQTSVEIVEGGNKA
mmetsp:Transcript_31414/g.98508  ORF Transcript_31414/g.98508 Transcript_31414/m.98508 type:complete len:80 (+) Transcript_31414:5541-5780(+)